MDTLVVLQLGVLVAMIGILLVAVEVGYRLGHRRVLARKGHEPMETGSIQGAMLGLLGLFLGFSFAGATNRFIERQDLINREANAIGTAYLRAELLDEPHSSAMKAALVGYLSHRVEASRTLAKGLSAETVAEVAQWQDQIWKSARAGVEAKPQAINMVIAATNEVIDIHSERIAAGRKHLPPPVLALLAACALLTLGVMGYAGAIGKRRNTAMTSIIAILIGASLLTTIDLDRPRVGLMRISDVALEQLLSALSKDSTKAPGAPATKE